MRPQRNQLQVPESPGPVDVIADRDHSASDADSAIYNPDSTIHDPDSTLYNDDVGLMDDDVGLTADYDSFVIGRDDIFVWRLVWGAIWISSLVLAACFALIPLVLLKNPPPQPEAPPSLSDNRAAPPSLASAVGGVPGGAFDPLFDSIAEAEEGIGQSALRWSDAGQLTLTKVAVPAAPRYVAAHAALKRRPVGVRGTVAVQSGAASPIAAHRVADLDAAPLAAVVRTAGPGTLRILGGRKGEPAIVPQQLQPRAAQPVAATFGVAGVALSAAPRPKFALVRAPELAPAIALPATREREPSTTAAPAAARPGSIGLANIAGAPAPDLARDISGEHESAAVAAHPVLKPVTAHLENAWEIPRVSFATSVFPAPEATAVAAQPMLQPVAAHLENASEIHRLNSVRNVSPEREAAAAAALGVARPGSDPANAHAGASLDAASPGLIDRRPAAVDNDRQAAIADTPVATPGSLPIKAEIAVLAPDPFASVDSQAEIPPAGPLSRQSPEPRLPKPRPDYALAVPATPAEPRERTVEPKVTEPEEPVIDLPRLDSQAKLPSASPAPEPSRPREGGLILPPELLPTRPSR